MGGFILMIIPLTREDAEMCREMAKERNNKNPGVRSAKYSKGMSDYGIHFFGLLGEFAVAKFLNIPFSPEVNRDGGDEGFDFDYNGVKIDVKYTRSNPAFLMFQSFRKFKADVAILTRPAYKNDPISGVKISGYISKEYFLEKAKKLQLENRRKEVYAVPARSLNNMKSFKDYCSMKEV